MPTGDTIDDRVADFFDLPEDHPTPIVITSQGEPTRNSPQEELDDHEEKINTVAEQMDEPVWFEWQEDLHGCTDEEIRNGRLALTTGVKYHTFDEHAVSLGHRVLLDRCVADKHGYPCVNFPDVPDPKPASEVDDLPDFDIDELEDSEEFATDIPTTPEEFERAESFRESIEESIIETLDYHEKEYRLFDLVRIYQDDTSYFTFNIETSDGDTARGRVTLSDDDTPGDVEVLY